MSGEREIRGRLLALVRETPGMSTTQAALAAGIAQSTADYHLRRLASEGEMTTQVHGRHRRWFAGPRICPVLRRAIPELRRPEALALARALDATPATSVELARRSGLPVGTVRWVSAVLDASFLLEKSRSGRVCLRPGAERCIEQAAAAAACPEWGRCQVSRAWEAAEAAKTRISGPGPCSRGS